jgi:hypothetical protein
LYFVTAHCTRETRYFQKSEGLQEEIVLIILLFFWYISHFFLPNWKVQSCPIAETPVRTWERRRSRAMHPPKHDPAKNQKPAAPMCRRKHSTTAYGSQHACARPTTRSR